MKTMQQELTMIIPASNNCDAGAVKRALMEGEDPNALGARINEHPVHLVALRREPENAVEIMRILIKHGACPNVIRADGKHYLLAIWIERAKWIGDPEPSTLNKFYQIEHMGNLEAAERAESQELVELVSKAIQNHQLCHLCKARKHNKPAQDIHLHMPNFTDSLLARHNRQYEESGYH
jgi:hypothetical protein